MFKSVISKIICVLLFFLKISGSVEISAQNQEAESEITNENGVTEEVINLVPNRTKNDLFWTESQSVDTTVIPISETKYELTTNEANIKPMKEDLETAKLPIENSNQEDATAFFEKENIPYDHRTQETSYFQTGFNKYDHSYQEMNEKIVLTRNNCNLEIPVDDTNYLKIQIKFESVQNNGHGKCCIALNGHKNAKLAVLISKIHLQNDVNSGYEETLKVVLTNYGVDFVLKQYYENQENQPLLLTESHKVFIFLQYNITNAESKPSNDYSQFNLEVFRYGESENAAYSEKYYKTALHSLPKFTGLTDIDKIYITTENPKFLSYVFKN